VRESCCVLGFAPEALDERVVGSVAVVEDLDRDAAAELLVLGEVDVRHPAGAEFADDSVTAVEDGVDQGVACYSHSLTSSTSSSGPPAVWGDITRLSFWGWIRTTVWPPASTTRFSTCGSIATPPLAIVEATIAICSGVTASRSCPNASRPGSTWVAGCDGKKSLPPLYRPLGTFSLAGVS